MTRDIFKAGADDPMLPRLLSDESECCRGRFLLLMEAAIGLLEFRLIFIVGTGGGSPPTLLFCWGCIGLIFNFVIEFGVMEAAAEASRSRSLFLWCLCFLLLLMTPPLLLT